MQSPARVTAIMVAAFFVSATGCSSQPSGGDGERAILDRIKSQSERRIKLASFRKTNGQKGELMGVQFYSLEFQAEIEFTEDCKWVTGMFGEDRGLFRTRKPLAQQSQGFNWIQYSDDIQNPGVLVKKGHREKLSGSIMFEKTERGWRAARVKIEQSSTQAAGAVRSGAASTDEDQVKRTMDQVKRTMADMRMLATAMEAYATDQKHYPQAADDPLPKDPTDLNRLLSPKYIRAIPADWAAFRVLVSADGNHYRIVCQGYDGLFERDSLIIAPDAKPLSVTDFKKDIIYQDGRFIQWPERTGRR